ncbi:hypothetical protein BH23GEM5_BH23GEM5_08010 [soil metagenome]
MKLPFRIAVPRVNARTFAFAAVGAMLTVAGCEGGGGLVDPPAGPEVASVSINSPDQTLELGRTVQLNATATSAAGNPLDRTFVWSSTDETRVRVSSTGMVTAVAPGTAMIRATVDGKRGEVQITVSPVAVASVEVVPNLRSVQIGDTVHLRVLARDAAGNELTGRQVTWASSDQTRAQVSTTGIVTGVSPGTATITATVGGRSGTSTITVTPGPVIAVSPVAVTLAAPVGGTASATVSVTNTGGGTLSGLNGIVTYAAGQPTGWLTAALNTTTAPATLTLTANATGLAPGTYNATVTVRSTVPGVADRTVAVTFTVTLVPISRLVVVPGTATIQVGNTVDLDAVALSAAGDTLTGRTVTWTSTDTTIATVSGTGLVTGVRIGTVTIRATSEGQTAEASITVTAAPTAPVIVLSQTTVTLSAQTGGSPAVATVNVTNGGDLPLTGLSGIVTYATGQPTGWLTAALSSTTAPATLTLTANAAGLTPGTYNATVTVRSAVAGVADQTVNVSFTVTAAPPALPAAPTGLTATVSGAQVTLNWADNATNETRYEVYRSTTSGFTPGEANRIATLGADVQTYTDTGLTAGTTYYYRVAACNSAGCTPSGQASATVPVLVVVPSAPTLSTPTVSGSQVTLTWTDVANETRYEVHRGTTSGFTPSDANRIATPTAGTTTYQDMNVPPGTYYYVVRACNVAGCSVPSNQVSATVAETAPAAPTSLVATAASATQINLSWNDNSANETEFRIERRTGTGGTYAQIATVGANVTTYPDTGLSSGTQYFYRVRACNTAGCSGFSNEASTTTQQSAPSAPTTLTATPRSTGNNRRIELEWTNVANETRYEVYRSTASGFTTSDANRIATPPADTTTYVDNTGLTTGTVYYYVVRACNAAGCSSSSPQATATAP